MPHTQNYVAANIILFYWNLIDDKKTFNPNLTLALQELD